jgi:hypothetical protein
MAVPGWRWLAGWVRGFGLTPRRGWGRRIVTAGEIADRGRCASYANRVGHRICGDVHTRQGYDQRHRCAGDHDGAVGDTSGRHFTRISLVVH